MSQQQLLDVLDRIQGLVSRGRLPVVVFDLDSTLFATQDRNMAILEEYAGQSDHADVVAAAAKINRDDLGWNPTQPLLATGLNPALLSDFGRFWKERFFTDAFVVRDTPHLGAVTFVNHVHERGALVYYLTGRHVDGMGVGTVQALTRHGFPFWRGRTTLHLKPNFEMPDRAYKQMAVDDIRSNCGEVVATFDNEPENCNIFQENFPEALNFWIDTEHSPDAVALNPALLRIDSFIPG
jgi:hypothetical protein